MVISIADISFVILIAATARADSPFDQFYKNCLLNHNECTYAIPMLIYDELDINCKFNESLHSKNYSYGFPKLFNDSSETCRNFHGLEGSRVNIRIDYPIKEIPTDCLNFNAENLSFFSLFISFDGELRQIQTSPFGGLVAVTELIMDRGEIGISTFPLDAFLSANYKCDAQYRAVYFGITFSYIQTIPPGALLTLWQHTNCSSISFNLSYNDIVRLGPGEFSNVTFTQLNLSQNPIKAIDPMAFFGTNINSLDLTIETKAFYQTNAFSNLYMVGEEPKITISFDGLHYDWYENKEKFQCFPKNGALNLCANGLKKLAFVQLQEGLMRDQYPFCMDVLTSLQCHNDLSYLFIDASLMFNLGKESGIFKPPNIKISQAVEAIEIITP